MGFLIIYSIGVTLFAIAMMIELNKLSSYTNGYKEGYDKGKVDK